MDSSGRFNKRSQWILGVAGGLLLAAGVLAVFRSSNDAASAVLVFVGAIFLLMAAMGRPPLRLKAGDLEVILWEATLAKAEGRDEEAQALLSSATMWLATQGDQGLQQSLRTRGVSPRPIQRDPYLSAGFAYEWACLEALREILATDERLTTAKVPSESTVDAIIAIKDMQIAVDIRAGTRFHESALVASWLSLTTSGVLDVNGFLLVINAAPGVDFAALRDRLRGYVDRPVEIIAWRPGDPLSILRQAIDRLTPSTPTANDERLLHRGIRPRRGSRPPA